MSTCMHCSTQSGQRVPDRVKTQVICIYLVALLLLLIAEVQVDICLLCPVLQQLLCVLQPLQGVSVPTLGSTSSSQLRNVYCNSETTFLHYKFKLGNVWGQ